jgi:hypothetical protein
MHRNSSAEVQQNRFLAKNSLCSGGIVWDITVEVGEVPLIQDLKFASHLEPQLAQ